MYFDRDWKLIQNKAILRVGQLKRCREMKVVKSGFRDMLMTLETTVLSCLQGMNGKRHRSFARHTTWLYLPTLRREERFCENVMNAAGTVLTSQLYPLSPGPLVLDGT